MHDVLHECVFEASLRVFSKIRARRYPTDAELIGLFKAHVLSFLEFRTSAIALASSTVLLPLDFVLIRFLCAVHVSTQNALFHFNLGPLSVRRDIVMLGINMSLTTLSNAPDTSEQ